jgi:uncharacterized membrane protein
LPEKAMTEATLAAGVPQLSKHRIEALVDGIFAVTMTLLVIELKLPEHVQPTSSAELLRVLGELTPTFFSWVISFLVLAIFWVGNHRLYSHVRHVDGPLLCYTIMMLAGASLLPFASAVNGRFLSQLAQGVYAIVMTIMSVGSLLAATHVYRHPELCAHPMDKATYRGVVIRLSILIAVAGLTVVLAGRAPGIANMAFILLTANRALSKRLTRGIQ